MTFFNKAKELAKSATEKSVELTKKGKEVLDEYNQGAELRRLESNKTYCSNIKLDYLGGGKIRKDGVVKVTVKSKYLKYGKHRLPISTITAIGFNTQQEIESRFTATRIFLLGVFSLAFKKRKKRNEKFITVEYNDGLEGVIIFGGKETSLVYNALREAYKQHLDLLSYLEAHNLNYVEEDIELVDETEEDFEAEDNEVDVNEQASDPYEEVKKAKELLDMGIISQEEFDTKKKELLGL